MTLALIAGTGSLPPLLVAALRDQNQDVLVCEMRGFAAEVDEDVERLPFRIETLGTFLANLVARGIDRVCMAGAVRRPDIDPTAIDAATAPLVPRLSAAMAKGDDGTLREIIAMFQERGLRIVGAHEIAPELLPPAGTLTRASSPELGPDLAAASEALAQMGVADEGQAVIVKNGCVIAREDARGTDAMLADQKARDDARGAVLVKAPKPGQSLLADMPTIGPTTAMRAAEAGLSGLVIAQGGVMVLDRPRVIETLDARGMFLWVRP